MNLEALFDCVAFAAGLLTLVCSPAAWRFQRERPIANHLGVIAAPLSG